jgi:hypothetical protein
MCLTRVQALADREQFTIFGLPSLRANLQPKPEPRSSAGAQLARLKAGPGTPASSPVALGAGGRAPRVKREAPAASPYNRRTYATLILNETTGATRLTGSSYLLRPKLSELGFSFSPLPPAWTLNGLAPPDMVVAIQAAAREHNVKLFVDGGPEQRLRRRVPWCHDHNDALVMRTSSRSHSAGCRFWTCSHPRDPIDCEAFDWVDQPRYTCQCQSCCMPWGDD